MLLLTPLVHALKAIKLPINLDPSTLEHKYGLLGGKESGVQQDLAMPNKSLSLSSKKGGKGRGPGALAE